jgi:hypothetical protein
MAASIQENCCKNGVKEILKGFWMIQRGILSAHSEKVFTYGRLSCAQFQIAIRIALALRLTLPFSFKFPADVAHDLAGIQIHVDSRKTQSNISEVTVWNKLAKV